MKTTEFTINGLAISYEVSENGYNIYLGGNIWVSQQKPDYIPYPNLTMEECCLKHIEDLCTPSESRSTLDETISSIQESLNTLTAKISGIPEVDTENCSLSDLITYKKSVLGSQCTQVIQNGLDVTLSDGEAHHFSLLEKDQTAIKTIYDNAKDPNYTAPLLWHSDNDYCSIFSKEDALTLGISALQYVTYNETLINHLNRYVESLTDRDAILAVNYSADSLQGYSLEHFNEIISTLTNAITDKVEESSASATASSSQSSDPTDDLDKKNSSVTTDPTSAAM